MRILKNIITVFIPFFIMSGCAQQPGGTSPSPGAVQPASYSVPKPASHTASRKSRLSYKGELPKTLAIFPFETNSITEPERFKSLGKGVSVMLTTGLSVSGAELKLVERENIRAIIEEMEFSQSGIVDQATAVKLGKILGAESIGFGSIMIMGNQARIDMRIIKVETSEVVMADFIMGQSDNIMVLVQGLAEKVADIFNMALHEKPSASSSENNMDAALLFSQGLDALDMGNREEADRLFAQSVSIDRSFQTQVNNVISEHEKRLEEEEQEKAE